MVPSTLAPSGRSDAQIELRIWELEMGFPIICCLGVYAGQELAIYSPHLLEVCGARLICGHLKLDAEQEDISTFPLQSGWKFHHFLLLVCAQALAKSCSLCIQSPYISFFSTQSLLFNPYTCNPVPFLDVGR